MSDKYEDIINMEHYRSRKHKPMHLYQRAAQFSAFAALTGYDRCIDESNRLTDSRALLSDTDMEILDNKFRLLKDNVKSHPEISVVFFREDEFKSGGAYVTVTDKVKKIDPQGRFIMMQDGTRIELDDIFDMSGELFREFERDYQLDF